MDKSKATWAKPPLGLKVVPIAGALMLVASLVNAQQNNCGPTDEVYAGLSARWGEARISSGMDSRGANVEIFANVETGTWTLLATLPNGMSCQIGAGGDFERFQPEPNA